MLHDLGIQDINEAGNGAKGLVQLKSLNGNIDLILCDLDMPEMNGLTFIEKLRQGVAGRSAADLPVVILTGHSDEDNIQKAIKLGIQGFLVKPVSLAALEKRIKSSIGADVIDPGVLGKK